MIKAGVVMNAFEKAQEIQQRILALRELTQDTRYGSQVKAGEFRLVRVEYRADGSSYVTAESDWLAYAAFIAFLDSQLI